METNSLAIDLQRVNKEFIAVFAQGLIESLQNGDVNAMDVALQIKAFEDVVAKIKDELRTAVIDQCMNYHVGERIVKHNGLFAIKEAGTKYDFANCNDPDWNELNASIEQLTEARKAREKFLRSLMMRTTLVNEDTGEAYTVNPPIKTSTTTYQITWEK